MTINFDTAVKGLERWAAPKAIEKSGFGKLKVEGQDVTVCAKAAGDIHKIGEQLHRLGDMNKTTGKEGWKANQAVVWELEGQINALGATLESIQAASSQLKTPGDIKAALKFSKEIEDQADQIRGALDGVMLNVDRKTQKHLNQVINTLVRVAEKNQDVKAKLKVLKVSKHLKHEKVDFLKAYVGLSSLPGIGKLIKCFAGLLVKLDVKVQGHLDAQLNSLSQSLKELNTVSGDLTSSTEAGELLKRTQEAKDQLSEFQGIARAIMHSPSYDLGGSGYNALSQARAMSEKLSHLEIELAQKKELLKQKEALNLAQAIFDTTHEYDISSANQLLIQLEEFENHPIATPVSPENGVMEKNLHAQRATLSSRAHMRLATFGLLKASEEIARSEVPIKHLEEQCEKIGQEIKGLKKQTRKNPGLAQKKLAELSQNVTQLETLQKLVSGDYQELIAHKRNIHGLRTSLERHQMMINQTLEVEKIKIEGQNKALTLVFQELNRLAADHGTPEKTRLENVNAKRSEAQWILTALKKNPVAPDSPNYPKYNAELSRAREARAMAKTIISMFNEKTTLEGLQQDLVTLDKARNTISNSQSLSIQQRDLKLAQIHEKTNEITKTLENMKLGSDSPHKALLNHLLTSAEVLIIETNRNHVKYHINILNDKMKKLSEEINTKWESITLNEIADWQDMLIQYENNLTKLLHQLPAGEKTTEYVSHETAQFEAVYLLRTTLADRKILLKIIDTQEMIEKQLKGILKSESSALKKAIALHTIIYVELPKASDSLNKVVGASKQESKNFTDYSTQQENIEILLRTATSAMDDLGLADLVSFASYGRTSKESITQQITRIVHSKELSSENKKLLYEEALKDVSRLETFYRQIPKNLDKNARGEIFAACQGIQDEGLAACEELKNLLHQQINPEPVLIKKLFL